MVKKADSIEELLENCPRNQVIGDNLIRAWAKINSPRYRKIVCSISGGSDSDIMLDIVWRCDKDNKVEYVWFDTGLEYEATKLHLKYLENKYNIRIKSYKAIKSIPTSCRIYGQPFMSKHVSEMISRLQRHDFEWENDSYERLLDKYCITLSKEDAIQNGKLKNGIANLYGKYYSGCVVALAWWCNENKSIKFCIDYNKWLKEFIIKNPPKFKISNRCCQYAKKSIIHSLIKENSYDLNIMGVRRAEGGTRAMAYKNCFDESGDKYDNYRPIFWYNDSDKTEYENAYDIVHSRCYTGYGLMRTGCSGCPYGRDFEYELQVIEKFEQKLFKAVNNIFGDSYEYTRQYREYQRKMNDKKKQLKIGFM